MDYATIICRLREGRPDAWERLCTLVRPRLRALAASQLPTEMRHRVDPSDIVQETLSEASLGLDRFDGTTTSQLLVWLAAILNNNLADAVRVHILAQRRTVHAEHLPGLLGGVATSGQDDYAADQTSPSMRAAHNESIAGLHRALQRLPPRQREAVRLRHLEGWAIGDIAAVLDCTAGAAAATVARGLRALRELDGRCESNTVD